MQAQIIKVIQEQTRTLVREGRIRAGYLPSDKIGSYTFSEFERMSSKIPLRELSPLLKTLYKESELHIWHIDLIVNLHRINSS